MSEEASAQQAAPPAPADVEMAQADSTTGSEVKATDSPSEPLVNGDAGNSEPVKEVATGDAPQKGSHVLYLVVSYSVYSCSLTQSLRV